MKNSKQTLAESSFILIFSTVFVKIIGAFFKIPLASDTFLGEIGFGYYSVAHDLYMPFYTLAISGLPVAVSHLIAEKISKKQQKGAYEIFSLCKKLYIICGIVCSIILAAIAFLFAILSNSGLNTSYAIFMIVPSVFMCFIISLYRGYFEGFSNMRPTAISKIIEALCKLILGLLISLIITKYTGDYALAAAGAMFSITIGTFFSTFYILIKYKRNKYFINLPLPEQSYTEDVNKTNVAKIVAPFVLASLSASLVALLDVFTVKIPIDIAGENYISSLALQYGEITGDFSTYLYGIRSKAFTIYYLIPTFTTSLGVGALPVLTRHWAKEEKIKLSENVNYTIKLITTLTFPAAIGMFALSERIMSLLYSTASDLDGKLLQIYSLAGLFAGIAIPLTTVLQSFAKHKQSIIHITIGIILKIAVSLSLVMIPQINILAAPIGTLVCYIYVLISTVISIIKSVGSINYISTFIKPFFSAILCGTSAYFVAKISNSSVVTVAAILVAVFVYCGFILITKTFTNTELKTFPILNMVTKSKSK